MLPGIKAISPSDQRIRSLFNALTKAGFQGDARNSYSDRLTYATDNSIYQVLPSAVIFPKHKEDIRVLCHVLNQSEFTEFTVTGRGGGTGTNGQSLTDGLVVDFSKYMNRVIEINAEKKYALIQPGVVLDDLNRQLKPAGYFFAPSVSTANRATIGGMVGTDASGKGSRVYGKTSDHILNLECVLIDGAVFETATSDESKPAFVENLETYLKKIKKEKADKIHAVFPNINRSVTGYNLKDALFTNSELNLNKLIAGSEGSLCFITEMCVKITPIPPHRVVALMKFSDFNSAINCSEIVTQANPDSIETVDDKILSLAMNDEVSKRITQFFDEEDRDNLKAFNLIEFSGNSEDELQNKMEGFKHLLGAHKGELNCTGWKILPYSESAGLWEMRAKGVGLLGNMPGNRKPVAFVEDCAVPPHNLSAFITEFQTLLNEYKLDYAMYGHVDVGCMHVRPALDLKLSEDALLIRSLSDRVNAMAIKYGGVLWGEHGKGYRGEYAQAFFGKEVYGVMQTVKSLFDPQNRMNPGKIAVPKDNQANRLIKIDEVPLRGEIDRKIKSPFAETFSASINCNGNGLCFHYALDYVMCPSYKENRDRIHSPKGRAGIIREWLFRVSVENTGSKSRMLTLPGFLRKRIHQIEKTMGAYDFSHEVYDAMNGCLSCKACTTQCPVKVDIPEQKSMFLELYHSRYPRPVRDYFIKYTETVGALQSKLAKPLNRIMDSAGFKFLVSNLIGMRDIPKSSLPAITDRLNAIPGVKQGYPDETAPPKSVILALDAFNTFYDAQALSDTAELLTKIGYTVIVPPFQANGKTMHVRGFLNDFRKTAQKNLNYLNKLSKSGFPILFVEPSILLTYRQEYKQYFPGQPIPHVMLLQEWLANDAEIPQPIIEKMEPGNHNDKMFLFLHCSEQTSILDAGNLWQSVFKKFHVPLETVQTGCCGMAGAFGHETAHYDASKGIYELSWKNAVRKYKNRVLVTGYSCRSQVKRFEGFRPHHPAEFLNSLLKLLK